MTAIQKLVLTLLLLVLNACAITTPKQPLMQVDVSSLHAEKAWYAVRFSIPWGQSVEPDWYLGTLIAGEVIAPLLEKQQQKIVCWRIHRRAVADKAGHVFSFIFYSSQADAAIIYQQFKNNPLLAKLHHQRLLAAIVYDPLTNSQTKIADTSDPIWPEQMRSAWPYFIMGVSQMWLEQIKAFKTEVLNESEIKQRYRLIQSKLTVLWRQQGQHALIHHLSALYAYEPLLTRF